MKNKIEFHILSNENSLASKNKYSM